MNSLTGADSWPIMYVRAIIIPSVMSPEMTACAAMNVTRMLVVWVKKTEPTCCICPMLRERTLILNNLTWMCSHSQRFWRSQLLSFISCMPCTSWIILLCSPADWLKRLMSSSRRNFIKKRIHSTYRALPARKMARMRQSYQARMAAKRKKLRNENMMLMELPIRNDLMRSWSPMRCMMSPVILVSKKWSGSFISFIRKSDMSAMLMRALMCSSIQLRRKLMASCATKSDNWAMSTSVTRPRLLSFTPTSTSICVSNGNAICRRLPNSMPQPNCRMAPL